MSHDVTIDAVLTKNSNGVYDFTLDSGGDIFTKNFLDTMILMSIFCERRATSAEMQASHLRRGWIGNESTPGFEVGSKLWLFKQARLTRDILNDMASVLNEAFKYMITDGIALKVTSSVELTLPNNVTAVIEISRPNSKVDKQFYELWNNTGVS